MKLVLITLVALLPGAVNWLLGRRLVAHADDATLPERLLAHRKRLIRVTWIPVVVVIFAGWHAFWLLPLLVIALLVGGFRTRVAITGESWGVGGYLATILRMTLAFSGFWLALAVVPAVIAAADSGLTLVMAAACALLLLAWKIRFHLTFLRLMGAVPMVREDDPEAWQGFDRVDHGSSIEAPSRYRVPSRGGAWYNAVALPHSGLGSVLISDPLLDLLDAAESTAIYAHEIAHLEEFDGRWQRRRNTIEWLLVVGAIVLVPALHPWGGAAFLSSLLWPVALFLGLGLYVSRSRQRESDSDRRAVELCGDAEALIGALTKLHLAARLPRRLAVLDEKSNTHPSLASRVRSIREAAGIAAVSDEFLPAVLRGANEGELILLEAERITWLEGVRPETDPRPASLREAAASSRTVRYSELAELRVAVKRNRPSLVALAAGRRKKPQVVELAAGMEELAQRALDAVDPQLANVVASSSGGAIPPRILRLLLLLFAAVAIVPPSLWAVALLGVVAACRLRHTTVVALGVTAVAGALVRLRFVGNPFLGADEAVAIAVIVGMVGGLLIWIGRRGMGEGPDRNGDVDLLVLVVSLVAAAATWVVIVLLSWSELRDGSLLALHRTVRLAPSAGLWLVAAASALLPRRTAGVRWMIGLLLALALVPLAIGSLTFRDRFVRDPLLARDRAAEPARRQLSVVAEVAVGDGLDLEVSPGGGAFALGTWNDRYRDGRTWRFHRFDGEAGEPPAVTAAALAWLDDDTLLALVRSDTEDGSRRRGWQLQRRRPFDAHEADWALDLPSVVDPELWVSGGSWSVVGAEPGAEQESRRLRLSGTVGEDECRETVAELPSGESEQLSWVQTWLPMADGGSLVVRAIYPESDDLLSQFFWLSNRQQIWLLAGDGASRLVVDSRLEVDCAVAGPRESTAFCLSSDREEWSFLWRLALDDGLLTPLVAMPAAYPAFEAVDSWTASLWPYAAPPMVVHGESGWATSMELPEEVEPSAVVATGDGGLVVLVERYDGSSSVYLLR